MTREVGEYLINDENGVYVDCTLGGGGHSEYLLENFAGISIVGIDRDDEALQFAADRLSRFGGRVKLVKSNFRDIDGIPVDGKNSITEGGAAGFLMDLGISSHQVDELSRGFSFRSPTLDMRMDQSEEVSAQDIVNTYPEEELSRIFFEYGEERRSRQIAKTIVEERRKARITTAARLAAIVGKAKRTGGRIDPATLVFQALRIKVNDELESLAGALPKMPSLLADGGRIVVLSYHSLEDRLVKRSFREMEQAGFLKVVTRKVVCATEEEQKSNPRSRSAKLRCAQRAERI